MKISIITPSFNQGEFIERTIQSVISQDCEQHELEYIIMDGGSTDQTLDILRHYSDQLIWQSESDNGQSHAVNKGLQRATGDVIGWLNSDDIYYPNALKNICHFFSTNPNIDVVYGDAYYIDRACHKTGFYPTESWNLERLKVRCLLAQPATFFRRGVILKYGVLDESLQFCMDYAYWLHLGSQGAKFAYLSKILAGVRIYAETKSSQHCLAASTEIISLMQQKLGFIPPEWLVRSSCAYVKTTSQLCYPELKFIIAVWIHLWETIGVYHCGARRICIWITIQPIMLKEFVRRNFTIFKKKFQYHLLGRVLKFYSRQMHMQDKP